MTSNTEAMSNLANMLKINLQALYERILRFNNPYYFYGVANSDYSLKDGIIQLKKLNLELPELEAVSILRGYPFALKIQDGVGGKFSWENEKVFLRINGLVFRINSSEEVFIIYEVFVTGVYRYLCARETVFVDIGMNSGVTTLFYAQDPLVKKIFAFELFKPTFLMGRENLDLNPNYKGKVEAFNYGLSNKTFESTIEYSISRKGRMGLKGLPADEQFTDVTREQVTVKNIDLVFEEIISASLEQDIVLKIDCEGEEFNLIESLAKSGQLGNLVVVMIEWHYVRPAEIENQLSAFDFHIFSQMLSGLDSGMIYASRRHTKF